MPMRVRSRRAVAGSYGYRRRSITATLESALATQVDDLAESADAGSPLLMLPSVATAASSPVGTASLTDGGSIDGKARGGVSHPSKTVEHEAKRSGPVNPFEHHA
eukprot:scaffold305_cov247-Pinguiococcus_pyrenoidosus.AAC.29